MRCPPCVLSPCVYVRARVDFGLPQSVLFPLPCLRVRHVTPRGPSDRRTALELPTSRPVGQRGPCGANAKGKEPDVTQPIILFEDEFELVMGLFEKVTHEKTEFLHHICYFPSVAVASLRKSDLPLLEGASS
jgi:hypothetical protein